MPSFNSWIKAARLRTLPLALSSILTGSFLAIFNEKYNWPVIIFSGITTIFLQVLSNMANDYGDSVKGTDNKNRVGPERTVQSGEISPKQMKFGVIFITILTLVSGIILLFFAFQNDFGKAVLFFVIGIGAIGAAISYTVGSRAYGYKGYGDFFVLVFFGLVGVLGTYYLNTHQFRWDAVLPALAIGFLSTGVLNLNNMRDMKNDFESGKHTLAARLGYSRAKIYHGFLIIAGILFLFFYILVNFSSYFQFLFLLPAIILIIDLMKIIKVKDQSQLDPFLKKLAIGTFLLSVFFGIGLII